MTAHVTESRHIRSLEPISTAHLFPALESELLKLLAALGPEDWEKQTVAPKWKVKDVAAHLLDTQLRKLSICRDRSAPESAKIASHNELVAWVDSLNEKGVSVYRRLSGTLVSPKEVFIGH